MTGVQTCALPICFPVTIHSFLFPSHDTSFHTPATTTAQLINALEEGTGFWNRIGGIVSNQSLYIRGYIDAVQTSPGIPGLLRMIVFYDRQANGALPAFNDVIRGVTNTGLNTNDGLTGINPINRERFLILYDKYMYGVGYLGTGTPTLMEGVNTQGKDGNNEFIIECYIPLRNLVTSYINELPTTPPTISYS